ncbi:ABC transporter permease [Acidocella sp.]|uniref:ABC transporter permease n=1 Tax=Acidocella sp. TaxID=50710 RepID=UPI00263062AF|nr:ABC transporter permease [Acidocella sp.]
MTRGYLRPAAFSRLGFVVTGLLAAALAGPLVSFHANRILPGDPRSVFACLPPALAAGLVLILAAAMAAAFFGGGWPRLAMASLGIAALGIACGVAASRLTATGGSWSRVSPGMGFWLGLFGLVVLFADAAVRIRFSPRARLSLVFLAGLCLAGFFYSGIWRDVSVVREYDARAADFWREGGIHIMLAAGSLMVACLIGIPLGIGLKFSQALRAPILNLLNVIQTIPSIALFGMLIVPLSWLAAHLPALAKAGINGVGVAPAFLALVLYSLLPVTANTLIGLRGVPAPVLDAARGMGLTSLQRLGRVELPLALPVILTGVRLVLVQNLGLATVAALIGGGGFGVFVFQGIGQGAPDLILLGALPSVILALAAAVVMDALIALTARPAP